MLGATTLKEYLHSKKSESGLLLRVATWAFSSSIEHKEIK